MHLSTKRVGGSDQFSTTVVMELVPWPTATYVEIENVFKWVKLRVQSNFKKSPRFDE
jgi:hypothetical protein